jgi:hypothetical protein
MHSDPLLDRLVISIAGNSPAKRLALMLLICENIREFAPVKTPDSYDWHARSKPPICASGFINAPGFTGSSAVSAISHAVSKLRQISLIEGGRDPRDRRNKPLKLTSIGSAATTHLLHQREWPAWLLTRAGHDQAPAMSAGLTVAEAFAAYLMDAAAPSRP